MVTTSRPVILAVDDEPEVLNAVARDLRRHYARDYQILPVVGGAEAIEAIERRVMAQATASMSDSP